jgi:photosystem II stability/assembly factor-like uncharacterized protein
MRPSHFAMTLGILAVVTALGLAIVGFDSDFDSPAAAEAANTGEAATGAAQANEALRERAREAVEREALRGGREGEAEEEGPPDEWLLTQRMYGSRISVAQLARASADALRLRSETAARSRGTQATWTFLGPETIGGRLLDIALDPADPLGNTYYVGSANGGVWKSVDGGTTFHSAWPLDSAPAVGALAMTSTGRLYAGTGEAGPGGGSITYGNKGVFVSDDGGETWDALGLEQSERISRIAIDPANEQRIFVAAAGPLFEPGGQRGVYRSVNGGQSWQRVRAGDNDTTGASDVLIDPANPQRVYAAMWDHLRAPAQRRYGGPGSGLLRSMDGGSTWQPMTNGLPPASADIGRVSIGMSPSNPSRLYALYIDAVGFFTGFFTSTDGGDSWTRLPNNAQLSNSQSSYGWWFARIWVDPLNETHVFVAGVPLMESTSAGTSWSQNNVVHADQHAMIWDLRRAGRVYLGNDGGFYRSDSNGGNPWTAATSQPYTQFYTVDVSEQDPSRVVGGAQDNFCLRSWTSNNPQQWSTYGGCGDGLETLINYDNQNIVYGCSQYGSCSRSTNAGDSSRPLGPTISQRRNWKSPLLFDPIDPSIMYYAGNIVNRSVDGGSAWTAISPDLTGGDPFPGPDEPYPFGTVTALAVGRSNGNVLYVGTDDARLWSTHNLGGAWTRASDPDLPQRWVTDVAVDPNDADVAYVTYTGFYEGESTPYVLRTDDGGTSWSDITGNLPLAPVNTVALDAQGKLVVGSDVGVWRSVDGGANWAAVGTGLPMVPVLDLRVHEPTGTLYAATFGRGMWKTDLPIDDSDGDGLPDGSDNCTEVANPTQCDTNQDGYGNACDADIDNSGIVNFSDLGLLRAAFLTTPVDPEWNPDADFDCNGAITPSDLGVMKAGFFRPPGPSGIVAP